MSAVAAAIVSELARAGTPVMFGVPGGGPNLDVVGAAAEAGLRFILTHAESAAVIMAATCADLTGVPGAAVVTRGPGLASAVNGIAHAALDRLPVVVIADTVPAAETGRISHQRLDLEALGRPVAKAVVTAGGRRADEAAASAVRTAMAPPPGPVIVLMDDSYADVPALPAEVAHPDDAAGPDPAGDGLAFLAAALREARRPVLLLGAAAIPHAAAVRAAVCGSGMPALHTYRARGIVPDTQPEAAGLITGGTAEWPLLAAADLILGLGVDEAELIPAAWDYAARTMLVPGYPAQRHRGGVEPQGRYRGYFRGAVTLAVPLPAAIRVLADLAGGSEWPPAAGRAARAEVARRLAQAACAAPATLAPQQVASVVRAHAPPDAVATVDAGAHMLAVMPLWEVSEPRRLLISSGLATMGFALPAAIAAALCEPARPVLAFTGDGGLGMTLAEIETAVRLRLRIVVIVFNDAALSLIKIKQRPEGQGGSEAVDYRPVSFPAVARAMGAAGASAASAAELIRALETALRREGPTVIDVAVDPAGYPAVMELSRGAAGRQSVPGLSPGQDGAMGSTSEHEKERAQ
jgi:acetolactate synthase I/II/III large subunit